MPFIEVAQIAGVATPIAQSLFTLAQGLVGTDYRKGGRTAEAMGISGMTRTELVDFVRQP